MLEKKVGAAILAAGYGQIGDKPKVLVKFKHKRLIQYSLDETLALGLSPVIVVNGGDGGFGNEIVCAMEEAYKGLSFAWQSGRRGPADAFHQALPMLRADGCTEAVGLFADMPFISRSHIRDLVAWHLKGDADLTISTWRFDPKHPLVNRMYGYANCDCVDRTTEDGSASGFPLVRKYSGLPEEGAEVLSSIYVLKLAWFEEVFPSLPEEDKGDGYPKEKHLPNLVEAAALTHARVVNMRLTDNDVPEIVGVNSLQDFQELSAFAGMR